MQLLILLSAFMTALSGVVTGRIAVPEPLVSSSAAVEAQAIEPAVVAAIAAVTMYGAIAVVIGLPPRARLLARSARIYLGRLRL